MRVERTGANRRERLLRIDKLGVTGSSPVPPTRQTRADWTFKLGPGFVVGIGNEFILGYLMLRSGLMPGGLALLE